MSIAGGADWSKETIEDLQREVAHLQEKVGKLEDALSMVLLFHSDGYWSKEKGARWKKITGRHSATTKGMCDHIRKLIKEEPNAPDEK